ncbi:MAG: bifunctional 4-hydroxy-2-oxoglutarate aldolase/2-dehydro-3-deoxy-phosphogluconate aldolase [Clostridia bacterium]|nr:bifunctional 4-hydroxy-2-oxoglutarate aldolase/2-dehydro-3-deoxy-phosphogluconate aldolase [Clostridia bacterium]MDE7214984.1 bifunctional 4-hydroxy-2-oxoglutarate aldolase/2-dehydro-3-deoxy-phosphogluconate aldolase [Clostridia bacterium]
MDALVNDLENVGIVPVIKLDNVNDAEKLAKALRDGGINCAEVTFRAKGADEVIRRMTKAYPDMLVGAGTVLTCEQVDAAVKAGAKFCVAPGLNPKVVKHCLEKGVPFAPGLSSASEIEQALELGLDFAKFFPAEQAGGLSYIKAVCGPYTTMRFMPTGGVTADNLNGYLAYKKIVCCGGSWIVPPALLNAGDWAGITKLCREAIDKMLGFEMVHVGLNCANPEEAEEVADGFEKAFGFTKKVGNSSVFASTYMEMMKKPFKGTHGHIAIATNSVKRAIYQLQLRGFEADESSFKYNAEGVLNVAYLKPEFGGFAVHLVLKK